jgi:hypothetical protein
VSLRRLSLVAAGLLLLLPPLRAASREEFPGLRRPWQYFQSPNFELYSANSTGDSRDLLEHMELLRAIFLETFKLSVRQPQPVTIYYFDRSADFEQYRPAVYRGDAEYSGFCLNQADRTVITLAPARDEDTARQVIYHEYVHHLFRITEQNPPPWYNEGMAELFSSLEEDHGKLVLGQPVVGRVIDLRNGRMLPFAQLFATPYDSAVFRDSGHVGIFYAQSWALLHYCFFGVHQIPREKVQVFLDAAGSPKAQEQPEQFRTVCREQLGYDYPGLLAELQRYIARGRFSGRVVPRPAIAAKSTYAVRSAPPEEMRERLAELSLRYTQAAYAKYVMLDLLGHRRDVRLLELLGAIALQEGDERAARERWNEAVSIGSANAAIFRELARLETNQVFSEFNLDYQMPAERATYLRTLLTQSIACAPRQSQGYEQLAWVEAVAAVPSIANVNLVQRHFATLNDRPRTLLALVLVRWRVGDREDALGLLDQLDKMNPGPWVAYGAELTRARIEGRPADRSKRPANDVFTLPSYIESAR